jgi:hypothetical protein
VERSLTDSPTRQTAGIFFASSVPVFKRKRHLRPTLLTWLQLTSGCFQNSKCILKGKRFSDVEDIKSSEKIFQQIFLFRISKTVLNNGRCAGNGVKNWREIALKNSGLIISEALKINY